MRNFHDLLTATLSIRFVKNVAGIGRAIATTLYSIGATVYAVSNDPQNLATLKAECPSINVIVVDLADWDATRAALEELPTIDHLVNCAGVGAAATFADTTAAILDQYVA